LKLFESEVRQRSVADTKGANRQIRGFETTSMYSLFVKDYIFLTTFENEGGS
jgi:hypothetical protein